MMHTLFRLAPAAATFLAAVTIMSVPVFGDSHTFENGFDRSIYTTGGSGGDNGKGSGGVESESGQGETESVLLMYPLEPYPDSMTITGEAVSDDEDEKKHFLVAGSNATAVVTLKDFVPCHQWHKFRRESYNGNVLEGESRHVIKQISIIGRAVFDGIGSVSDRISFMAFESSNKHYTTPATHDLVFTYDLSPMSEGSETYSIVSATDPKGHAIDTSEEDPTGRSGVFTLPMKFPIGSGFHGAYWWTAHVVWEQENHNVYTTFYDYLSPPKVEVEEWTDGPFESSSYPHDEDYSLRRDPHLITNETGWVFFEKYGHDNNNTGVPNWFVYWKEDGACPSLKEWSDRGLIGPNENPPSEDLYGAWQDDTEWFKNELLRQGKNYDSTKYDGRIHLQLKGDIATETEDRKCYGAAACHYWKTLEYTNKKTGKNFKTGGKHIYGIYTVEEVLAHEAQHRETHYAYEMCCNYGHKDSDRNTELWEKYEWEWHWSTMSRVPIDCINYGHFRCDFLSDRFEMGRWGKFGLDIHDTDTFGVESKDTKTKQYRQYGDDEFLAMVAANKASDERRAMWKKDWAFPGEQSYIPQVVREARNSVGWDRDGSGPPRSWSSSLSGTRQAETLLNSASVKDADDESVPSLSVTDFTKEINHEEGRIASISYTLEMEASGFQSLGLHSVLTDMNSNIVAHAYAEAPNGKSSVELRFDGEEIFRSGKEGPFRLDRVELSEYDGVERTDFAALIDFQDAEVDVRRSNLAKKDAYLLGVVEETAFTNGITVTVAIEVNTPGRYEIAATLGTDDKAVAASCSVEDDYVAGTNRVELQFWSSGIYGKCTMNSLVLSHEGVQVESRLDFYTLRKLYEGDAFSDFEGKWADATPEEFMAQFEDYVPPKWFWVFLNPNGGTIPEVAWEVLAGNEVGELPTPTWEDEEDAEFLGWFTELEGGEQVSASTIFTTNVMFHARWDGVDIPSPPTDSPEDTNPPDTDNPGSSDNPENPDNPEKPGNPENPGSPTASATYSVEFNANGGEGSIPSQTLTLATTAALPKNAFTRKGYVFLGWALTEKGEPLYTDMASVQDLAEAGKRVTLYAKWAKKNYKVKFVANGGKGKMAVEKMTYGKAKKLSKNKFTRDGYKFKGWATSKSTAKKGKVAYKNKKKVKNLTTTGKTVKLYAVWKKK